MIREIIRGFAGDPAPGPGRPGSLSRGSNWTNVGSISMVGSMGRQRDATYRSVYLSNPYVYAAVEMHAKDMGRLPIHVYGLDDQARKTRIRGDVPLPPGRPTGGQSLDRLLQNSQPGLSRNAKIGGTIRDQRIYGNALWEIERNGGAITALPRIPWRRVRRVEQVDDYGACQYEIVAWDSNTQTRWVHSNDVIHFGYWSDPECPISPSWLESCRYTLALHDAVVRHLIAYFHNSMRPSGHLSVDGLKRDQLALIRETLIELYSSPENAGKILVTSGKFESMTGDLENAEVADLLRRSSEEIATATLIPPPMLGILESTNKATLTELREHYGRDSLGPLASDFEQELMAQLLPQQPSWSSLFVEFQLAEKLRPDLEARAEVYAKLMHVFAVDEIRGFENMPAFDIRGVTDVPWVPSGAMPLTVAAQARPGVVPAGPQSVMEALMAAVRDGRVPEEEAAVFIRAAELAGLTNGNGSHGA